MTAAHPLYHTRREPILHIIGRYTAPWSLALEGNALALKHFAQLFRHPHRQMWALQVPDDSSPDPYDRFLTTLLIDVSHTPLLASVEDTTLSLAGSPESLELFATNIAWFAEGQSNHMHIEYYEGCFPDYMHRDSLPMVLVLASET